MDNNTNKTSNSRRGRSNTADFKPRRGNSKKENVGLGAQPISLEDCNYAMSTNGTELVKLDLKHLGTGIKETFNFINGSAALDAIMDVLDETGELDIDFKDYIGKKMNVEVVESGKFRNVISAWVLSDERDDTKEDTNEEVAYEDDFGEEESEDEIDISDLLSGSDD